MVLMNVFPLDVSQALGAWLQATPEVKEETKDRDDKAGSAPKRKEPRDRQSEALAAGKVVPARMKPSEMVSSRQKDEQILPRYETWRHSSMRDVLLERLCGAVGGAGHGAHVRVRKAAAGGEAAVAAGQGAGQQPRQAHGVQEAARLREGATRAGRGTGGGQRGRRGSNSVPVAVACWIAGDKRDCSIASRQVQETRVVRRATMARCERATTRACRPHGASIASWTTTRTKSWTRWCTTS